MKALFIVLSVLLMATLLISLLFKGCNSFISSFDGDNKSKMINLTRNYYYNETDRKIWEKEEATNSYKNVYNSSVDSLMWNSKLIVGYSRGEYFAVFLGESDVKVFNKKNSLQKYLSEQFYQLDNIPPLNK